MATRNPDEVAKGTDKQGTRRQLRSAKSRASGHEPLAATVADWIRMAIVEGQFNPGQRIRQEAVAEACGTSRIPVREALNRLRNEGLVTLTSHVGARVATLDLAELDEIYLLREQLEPFALAESIPRLRPAKHRILCDYVAQMEEHADPSDPSNWVEVDRLFHLTSYSAAPLPQFLELIEGFWNRTQQYRRAYTRLPESYDLAHMEHRLLLHAIERRDVADAQAISTLHIRRTRLTLDQHADLFDS
jgi:DNA-binding GntR family transcriptional regulator